MGRGADSCARSHLRGRCLRRAQRPGGKGVGPARARVEPYPDVVLPVVSLLELLCRIGKSLQSKRERRSEPGESERSRASPTSNQDPAPTIPLFGGSPRTLPPLRCAGRVAEGGIAGSSAWRRTSRAWRDSVSLFAPAFPRASQCLQRNCCHLNSTRAEPSQLGGCWHYCRSRAGSHLWCRARAEPGSLH